MKLKETDDSGELREFDLSPGEKGMCVAILGDGTTWTSEITNADFAAWQDPPVKKKPSGNLPKPAAAMPKPAAAMPKPAAAMPRPAAAGAWRMEGDEEDEDLAMEGEGEGDEEGEGEEEEEEAVDEEMEPEEDDEVSVETREVHAQKVARSRAEAELLKAKPAAADPSKCTDERGRTFDYKTEKFQSPMYYKKSHSVGLRVKGGSQLISFGGLRCTSSKEYLYELGRQLMNRLNNGELGLAQAKEHALSKLIFE